jgi:hypothetical protein
VNCEICGQKDVLATKIVGRSTEGQVRCHRFVCGHAWHVATVASDPRAAAVPAAPVRCTCSEIAATNALLVEGNRYERMGDALTQELFEPWWRQVLEVLDGIPSESGAPSLVRSATTAGKSPNTTLVKKVSNLNALLGKALKAVS